MKIHLRIAGPQLLASVAAEVARQDSAFPRQLSATIPLHWQIEALPSPFNDTCLDHAATQSVVMLVEVRDDNTIEALWSANCRNYDAIGRGDHDTRPRPPVILAIDRKLSSQRLPDLPPFITDWVNGIDAVQELALRVLWALKRLPQLTSVPDCPRLSLSIESRRLWHADQSVLLTPCEIPLAELFLSRFGCVIPLEELQLLFKLAGRSVESSNVRVAMFQLRLKIEALTHWQYTLASAYALGYVLRHGKAGDARKPAHESQVRQSEMCGD